VSGTKHAFARVRIGITRGHAREYTLEFSARVRREDSLARDPERDEKMEEKNMQTLI